MATDTASGDTPTLTARERWDGDVVAQTQFVYRWGTHAFAGEIQAFADGEGYVNLTAPSDPPPSARQIVAAGLAGEELAANVAAVLADAWGIDTDDLAPAPPAAVERAHEDSEVSA